MLNVATRNRTAVRTKQRQALREQGLHHRWIGKFGYVMHSRSRIATPSRAEHSGIPVFLKMSGDHAMST